MLNAGANIRRQSGEPDDTSAYAPQTRKKAIPDISKVLLIIGILSTCAGIAGFIANTKSMGLASQEWVYFILDELDEGGGLSFGDRMLMFFAVYKWLFLIIGIALIFISIQVKKKNTQGKEK